jgi:regulator of nucleoside diphosphate kinase
MPDDLCRLITPDFHILQELLAERSGGNDPLGPLLQGKLSRAQILPAHDIPSDVVTLYSRIRYRVGTQAPVTRIVIPDAAHEVLGATLPVTHPRGLALLGIAEGTRLTFCDTAGECEEITVEKVVYQPQAARRQLRELEVGALRNSGSIA